MYADWAHIYDAVYSFKDYGAETDRLLGHIRRLAPDARTLLDVACGTGKHLEQLREHFEVEGLDLEDRALEIAYQRLPEVPLHTGDMRDFDLGRTFDVVTCLFSSIGYMKSLQELDAAIENMVRHLNSPGLLIVEPWLSPEEFEVGHLSLDTVDESDMKIARIVLSDLIQPNVSVLDMQFLVGTGKGIYRIETRHELGLFTRSDHEEAMRRNGLMVEFDPEGLMNRGLYLGTRSPVR